MNKFLLTLIQIGLSILIGYYKISLILKIGVNISINSDGFVLLSSKTFEPNVSNKKFIPFKSNL